MTQHGKKYLAAKAKFDPNASYDPRKAIELVKETSYAEFDGTVEIHLKTGLDPRQADQQVRDVVVLPHGLGKTVRVLVFAHGEGSTLAQQAGADVVADTDEVINRIQGGWTDLMWPSLPPICWVRWVVWVVSSARAVLCRTPKPVP